VIVFILALFFGFRPELSSLPLAFLFMALIAILFTALGTAIGSFLEDMQGFQLIMNFLLMPIFFLSGALFPLTGLPGALETITRLDPLSYGVDGLRAALEHAPTFGIALDFGVLAVLTALFLLLGGFLFSRIQI
jgi:ABC-2 type transport system permease protein